MSMLWRYDKLSKQELDRTITLVQNNVLRRSVGNRRTMVIPPINREPPRQIAEPEKNWAMHWSVVNELNTRQTTSHAILQVQNYPKLRVYFPELVTNMDISGNKP